jgi:hypothetical protein
MVLELELPPPPQPVSVATAMPIRLYVRWEIPGFIVMLL